MAFEERNFRSYYYEKFGFRVVEEKKSVEILLKEPHINIEKLQQFCLRFPVPAVYRIHVWKILLGILPATQSSHNFVQQQREQQLADLKHGLDILSDKDTDRNGTPERTILKLFLLERAQLPFLDSYLLVSDQNKSFASIAAGVCKVTDVELDRYWISSRFFIHVSKFKDTIAHYPELTLRCLKKEDMDKKLWNHVLEHKLFNYLPLSVWFSTCFADVLPDVSFQRIWDRIIGGSTYVLVYVAVAILIFFKRPLLSMKSVEDMVVYLEHISEDCGDRIVNEALELWSKNGSCLLMSKCDSPVVEKSKT